MQRREYLRKGGFTLIEVLLVLVILTVLASLAVMSIGPIQRRAYLRAATGQIGLFKTPIETYQMDVQFYPQALEDLRMVPAGIPNPNKWNGPYIEAIPPDPWGNPYQYLCPGMHRPDSYDVWSCGPDGLSGTEDDIGNWDQGGVLR
jgi:general secretion pathway protein G